MKVKLKEMQEAFAVCDAVGVNAVLDSSRFVRLKNTGSELQLTLTGSLWAEASVTPIDKGGKWTTFVDRRALKAFLATTKDPEVELFFKTSLILRSDQRLEVAPHVVISGYETWSPKTTFNLTDSQIRALRVGVKYLPNVAGSERMEAAYFGNKSFICTDGLFFMAVVDPSATEFFVPAEVAKFVVGSGGKLAADSKGSGVVLSSGFVYQPLNSELDKYPKDPTQKVLEESRRSPIAARVKASEALSVLTVASQFLLDKNEAAKIEAKKDGLLVTVAMNAGTFQRTIPVIGNVKLDAPVNWSVKKLLPWLEYAVSIQNDVELEYSKQVGRSAFQFHDGKRVNVLLFSDL